MDNPIDIIESLPETDAKPSAIPEAMRAEIEALVDARVSAKLTELRAEPEKRASEVGSETDRPDNPDDELPAPDARVEELNRREAELKRRELRARTVDLLTERDMPRELAEFIDCADEAECVARVDALEKLFRSAVQRALEQRLSTGHSLPRSSSPSNPALVRRLRTAAGLRE